MKTADLYYVKPSEKGLKVPNPDAANAHLPEEGMVVVWSPYWQRRLDSKEIERSDAPKQEPEHKTKQKEAAKVDGVHKDQGGI